MDDVNSQSRISWMVSHWEIGEISGQELNIWSNIAMKVFCSCLKSSLEVNREMEILGLKPNQRNQNLKPNQPNQNLEPNQPAPAGLEIVIEEIQEAPAGAAKSVLPGFDHPCSCGFLSAVIMVEP